MSTATMLLPVPGDEAAIRSLIESVGRIRRSGIGVQTKMLPGNFAGPSSSNAWDERWETPLLLEWKNLKIDVAGGFARCDGFLRVSVTKKGTDRPTRSWKCVSVRLQRIEDEWQFVHVHFRSVLHERSPLQAV
ncbi:MAG TPA: hypothetical protein VME23_03850 [Terracidiphilus sp.]|nr:hypothetical protein [Terracidiphilus sp.]